MNTNLTPCPSCGQHVSTAARACPQCGHTFPRVSKRTVAIVLAIGAVLWGIYEYDHDRSEREGIRLRDEAKRKMNDYDRAHGNYGAPVKVRIVNE